MKFIQMDNFLVITIAIFLTAFEAKEGISREDSILGLEESPVYQDIFGYRL